MAKATTDQEAAVREAQAQQIKINAARDVSLREAETKTQVAAAQARADQAGPLAQAEATQEVVRKQTELAQLEADRKEKELLSTTVKPAAAEAQAVIARAEGEKRARIASAEADAETTRLEGGAEAQIVLTKGEAEAKALAMRADAYKQFNEAAIIQTVLAALPEIVRAAAEPMSHIESLTVMSADGASDLVRNATRAMIESTTAIKGLTGLDVPDLVGSALGGRFADRMRGGGGDGQGKSTVDQISALAGEGLKTMPARVEESAAAAEAKVKEVSQAAEAQAKPAVTTAAASAAASVKEAAAATQKAADAVAAQVKAAAKQMPDAANEREWARWTADQLARVPSIQLFSTVRLSDLVSRGPAQAQAIWRTAQAALGENYGNMTIAQLLEAYQGTKN
jgi:flotillin